MATRKQRPDQNTPEARVRRGCMGVAILLTAVTWVLILSSGNLAWSLLMIVVVLILLARQFLV